MTDKTDLENTEDATAGLKANNADLKKRLDAEKVKTNNLEARLADLEAAQADAQDTNKTELERERAAWQREKVKLERQVSALTNDVKAYRIDAVVNDAITANNVMTDHIEMVRTFLKNGAAMNDAGEAMCGDIPLGEHISTFFSSPSAKHYVAAPVATGGGAKGTDTSNNVAQTNFGKAPQTNDEWNKFFIDTKDNQEAANAQLKAWGITR